MTHTETATGRYHGLLSEEMLPHLEEHLLAFDLPVRREAERLEITAPLARAALVVTPQGLEIAIHAVDAVQLYHMRESAMYLLDHVSPDVAAGLTWADGPAMPARPPSLHDATVLSTRRIGANYLRVEMASPGAGALGRGGMHFSLLLPGEGRALVLPYLNERGRTVWPEGPDALHRVGYTFVTLEAGPEGVGRFTFDIYLHAGGRTSDWALAARPGERVAVMGPGGGDFPPGERLLIAGDETALPAIRRILEASPATRRGRALIELADPADRCEIAAPPGVAIDWVERRPGAGLLEALRAVPMPEAGTYLWVAAEQSVVRQAKEHFRAAGRVERGLNYFSSYWEAPAAG